MHFACVEFRDNSFIAAHAKFIELRIVEHANRLRALTKQRPANGPFKWLMEKRASTVQKKIRWQTAILVENETTNTAGQYGNGKRFEIAMVNKWRNTS